MPTNQGLNINVRGLDEVKTTLEGYTGTRMVGVVTEAGANEIVAIMKEQPDETPYKYYSRAEAYPDAKAGPGWFSPKQRRYVMAKIRSGDIKVPYQRTGQTSGAWHVSGRLSTARAVNDAPAAQYVFGNQAQSRHEAMVGWKKVRVVLDENSNRIFDAAYEALRKQAQK